MLYVLSLFLPLLLSIAFITIGERRIMGSMQRRIGPNIVGFFGSFQAFADALKLLVKEIVVPWQSNHYLFIIGLMITLAASLLGWAVLPFSDGFSLMELDYPILFTLAITGIGIYGILVAGWGANSKYTILGAVRATAQMISYELILTTTILIILLYSQSTHYSDFIEIQRVIWFIYPLFPWFILCIIAGIAETNRGPMDLVEAESELVSGSITEHGASVFVYFFLAEYGSLFLMSHLLVFFFLGGYLGSIWFLEAKVMTITFIFIWVRASFPRIRYDHLIQLGWCELLPLAFAFFILYLSFFLIYL